jgi:hypothetical protein
LLVLFISLFIGGLLTECLYPSFLKRQRKWIEWWFNTM